MRIHSFLLLVFALGFFGCSNSSQSIQPATTLPSLQRGMQLVANGALPFDSALSTSVAKVYNGNEFITSGAFVSSNGLFISSNSVALQYFTSNYRNPVFDLSSGYLAQVIEEELPIPGISLWVEVEQVDVTSIFDERIADGSSNFEISQVKQEVAQSLVNEKKELNPDAIVQIKDVFAGNKQVMSVYKVIDDVRLVYTPPLAIQNEDLASNSALYETISDQFAIFRAYSDSLSDDFGIPYQPDSYVQIESQIDSTQPFIALGFPDRSYRLESERAFEFYKEETNPFILEAYRAFSNKEEVVAERNSLYALATVSNRYRAEILNQQYQLIQNEFLQNNLLEKKISFEQPFRNWLASDTTLPISYPRLYEYINQAFDIADQNGAVFYSTFYIHALSPFDDIANSIKSYMESGQPTNIETLVNTQFQQLGNIAIEAEVDLYIQYLYLLTKLSEDQQILSIQSIIEGVPEEEYFTTISSFMKRMQRTSFVLNPEMTAQVLENNLAYNDSLYQILDESLFMHDMARNNQSIYVAYLQPARQLLVDAKLTYYGEENLFPDANTTLRYNIGSFDSFTLDAKFVKSNNDFSGKAPGSILITPEGKLLGIVGERITENISNNYLYREKGAYLRSIRSDFILNQIESIPNSEQLLMELTKH